jgi:hypothetical protein
MKIRMLSDDYKKAIAGLRGKHPAPEHVDEIIDHETKLVAPTGDVIAILLKQRISPELYNPAYKGWKTVDELPSNRALAVGSPSLPNLKKDGTLSPRHGVAQNVLKVLESQGVRQGILGYLDATASQPCHKTPLTERRPELLYRNKELVKRVDELYAKYAPVPYAVQLAEVAKCPRWRLWHTAFTTAYVIKSLRCAYHYDSGNLRGVMSALMPMGHFTGGELVLPRWRRAIAFKPGDLLLFDPQQLHGNLPFEGERLSVIFYCERRIALCCRQRIYRFPRT